MNLVYNTATHIGTYLNGGKVVNGTTVLTSKEGYYYGETRDMYFKKKCLLNDPEYKVTLIPFYIILTRRLQDLLFLLKLLLANELVRTTEGYYDMKNKKAVFGKRPVVDDKDYTLTADDLGL